MQSGILVAILLLSVIGFWLTRHRAAMMSRGLPKHNARHTMHGGSMHSRPVYYGTYTAMLALIPALLLLLLWSMLEPVILHGFILSGLPETETLTEARQDLMVSRVENIALGYGQSDDPVLLQAAERWRQFSQISLTLKVVAVGLVSVFGLVLGWRQVKPHVKARVAVENMLQALLIACSVIAILTTVGILLSVLFEAIRFFQLIPVTEFLFGTHWSPQIAIRADQQGASGAFGAIPLFAGTFMISLIAMCIAAPVGLMSAIYLSEYASSRVRHIVKPVLEILAGIPTVVYGFFAALIVAPMIRNLAHAIGFESASSESALAAGAIMGMMIIPFVSSLSDDVIRAVPKDLRDGALSLGATQSETITKVVLPAALPGIVGGLLLAVSRAIGETMIVVMAAGLSARLTVNPLESVTTVTVQIVTLLVGDQEFDSPKTLAAFALGLTLFLVTLALNFVALRIVKKYREQYD
ncbi:phosphate ABC transporter permease subunit PstC [Photobacterium galatheae]|uniref:Phosphate transport system permease protein n=1 Tax=Photobacterium galatheae TaxID=1654360 RepID=A0A066RQG4_9GAMM|nr:phosphate ABC transporter permease subunit PstC [Photobacterium galatheae]KDM89623.1 phosphate ABC transporter permease [Photobacterium galatheae]MCM0150227.1 phosphate ABC transporter permease subunit PstC [Photobacterium galatheae]